MKKLFYAGIAGVILFEILNVYFIMPMPGSQRMHTIDLAYFLYTSRWFFRIIFWACIVIGARRAFEARGKWAAIASLVPALGVVYLFNFRMTADHMFRQPQQLSFKDKTGNTLSDSSVVVAVENKGEVKAYPVRYIVYHHQVQDSVGGKPLIITYCSVCRTGRVYEPQVKGHHEKFRLVGMDHFNAMFEDAATKSWWRQATGEAVVGPLKNEMLPEFASMQLTIKQLFDLYPRALVMQADEASKTNYDSLGRFERGKSRGDLTRTDSLSWQDKSWVVGIQTGASSKAYDWAKLKEMRIINDKIGEEPIVLVIATDNKSFFAFERPSAGETFAYRNDSLFLDDKFYDFSGTDLSSPTQRLKRISAYQEFWHSWRTFHPNTGQYK